MPSLKGTLLHLFGRPAKAEVVDLRSAGDAFVLLTLQGPASLRFEPGDKVDVLLPGKEVRSYTPFGWDEEGRFHLLVHRHGGPTPTMRWMRTIRVGDVVPFVGPRASLRMIAGPVVMVGDETGLGVAAAFHGSPEHSTTVILEVGQGVRVDEALSLLGLHDAQVFRRGSTDPRPMLQAIQKAQPASFGLTGGQAFVDRVRKGLKDFGSELPKTRVYWAKGKSGLA